MRSTAPERAWLRRAVAAGVAACAIAVGNAAQAGTDAATSAHDFVASLYDGYRQPGGLDPMAPARLDRVFAPALSALIRQQQADANGEAGALDYDPICACQDFDIANVVVEVLASRPASARVRVRFDNSAEHQVVRLDLARVNGQWRVADVHDERVASLVAFLKKAHAQALADAKAARR